MISVCLALIYSLGGEKGGVGSDVGISLLLSIQISRKAFGEVRGNIFLR